MTINADLKLAFPIRWSDDAKPLIWAYHTPLSREVFDANYRVIAATKAALFSKGLGYAAEIAPTIASLALQDAARQDALESGVEGDGARPLLAELKRLTMVLAPGAIGYELIPAEVAVARKVIDDEDWSEAESGVVFFTCGYAMTPRRLRENKATALALILRGSTTSLAPLEWVASLPKSTEGETSEPAPASSLPS